MFHSMFQEEHRHKYSFLWQRRETTHYNYFVVVPQYSYQASELKYVSKRKRKLYCLLDTHVSFFKQTKEIDSIICLGAVLAK